jgi:hypothetical protein
MTTPYDLTKVGEYVPASRHAVEQVLAAPVDYDDGRSDFVWVRLANGDLMLGVWPTGDTYTYASELAEADFADPDKRVLPVYG